MLANSQYMTHFRINVASILDDEQISVTEFVRTLNELRAKRKETEEVSRTFVSNLLHGHKPCSIPFAEEISAALKTPLPELISAPAKKRTRQTA